MLVHEAVRESEDTRDNLIQAAGPIFAEKGFEAATIREICREAGANIAAVNYHFRDKGSLYLEAVRFAARNCNESVPMPELPADAPFAAKLHAFILTFLRRVIVDREPQWCGRLIMRELFEPTAACVEFVRDAVRPNFETLMAILHEALPGDTPEITRHQIAFSIVGQCLHYRFAVPVIRNLIGAEELAEYDAEHLAEHITGFTLAALGLARPIPAKGRRKHAIHAEVKP